MPATFTFSRTQIDTALRALEAGTASPLQEYMVNAALKDGPANLVGEIEAALKEIAKGNPATRSPNAVGLNQEVPPPHVPSQPVDNRVSKDGERVIYVQKRNAGKLAAERHTGDITVYTHRTNDKGQLVNSSGKVMTTNVYLTDSEGVRFIGPDGKFLVVGQEEVKARHTTSNAKAAIATQKALARAIIPDLAAAGGDAKARREYLTALMADASVLLDNLDNEVKPVTFGSALADPAKAEQLDSLTPYQQAVHEVAARLAEAREVTARTGEPPTQFDMTDAQLAAFAYVNKSWGLDNYVAPGRVFPRATTAAVEVRATHGLGLSRTLN